MKRFRAGLIGLAVIVLLVVALTRLVRTNGPTASSDPDSFEALEVPGSGVIRWSPDATKLAFVANGELVIVRVADGATLARRGGTVADAAWMPDATRVVVVEGPIPTGQVNAVRTDGELAGTTKLRPSISFGEGRGLALDSRGTQAAAIATRRDPIGGATHHDLAIVNLQSGDTRVLVTEDREESNPVFVDDQTVAYAGRAPGGQIRLHAIDLSTGAVVAHGPIHDGPFGALASGDIVVGQREAPGGAYRLDAVAPTGDVSRVLGILPRDHRPVAIDRFGTRALVRRFGGLGGTRLTIDVLSDSSA